MESPRGCQGHVDSLATMKQRGGLGGCQGYVISSLGAASSPFCKQTTAVDATDLTASSFHDSCRTKHDLRSEVLQFASPANGLSEPEMQTWRQATHGSENWFSLSLITEPDTHLSPPL